jgi:hypothetical protein
MAKKFSSLRKTLSKQAQAEVAGQVKAFLSEMPLRELRRARGDRAFVHGVKSTTSWVILQERSSQQPGQVSGARGITERKR